MMIKRFCLILTMLLLFSAAMLSADPLLVSVLYFENTGGSEELGWLEKGLADMLLTDLSLSEEIKAIEREQLEKVLAEQRLSLSGLTDEKQSIEIGKLLSAQMLLGGSFVESGGRLRIDGKLIDTATGEIRAAVKSEGSPAQIFGMEKEILLGIFSELGITPPDGIDTSKSSSVDAAESYYTGLELFDEGRYAEAVEYYRKAALEDPQYDKPRAGLEESYKFLKDFRNMRYQREINSLLSKADILRRRLEREPWITYGDFLMQEYAEGHTDNDELSKRAEEMGLLSGETPAVCAWNLQVTLYETADLALEYFEDEQLADYSYSEITGISRMAREKWNDDPFLPELIYQELLVTYYSDNYEAALPLCEELMIKYPDYRMMWAVEEFYEDSLMELEASE